MTAPRERATPSESHESREPVALNERYGRIEQIDRKIARILRGLLVLAGLLLAVAAAGLYL